MKGFDDGLIDIGTTYALLDRKAIDVENTDNVQNL